MSRNSANPIAAPYTSSSSKEVTAALPFPAAVLRNAGTLVIQLLLGEIPNGRLVAAGITAVGGRPSYYMKVEPDLVLHCRGCGALHKTLTDLQVQLAGPLAVLLGTGGEPPAALREELDRELQVLAAEKAPPSGSEWSALLQQTIEMLVRHWPVILAVAELLRVRDSVAPLDLLEVAVQALRRLGPLPPELGSLLRFCEGEARDAVSSCARQAVTQQPCPEEVQLRDALWRWETLALQVEEAEQDWGPPRPVQHAVLVAAARALRLQHGAAGRGCPRSE